MDSASCCAACAENDHLFALDLNAVDSEVLDETDTVRDIAVELAVLVDKDVAGADDTGSGGNLITQGSCDVLDGHCEVAAAQVPEFDRTHGLLHVIDIDIKCHVSEVEAVFAEAPVVHCGGS